MGSGDDDKVENHNIPPVWDANSRILILGSFPSVKSRNDKFFYAHPQNRFWRVLSTIIDEKTPQSIGEKKVMLLNNHIALWDVIGSCDITGSADSSIKNVVANDINLILLGSRVERIYTNGGMAYKMYNRYCRPSLDIDAVRLPSTSPANASFSFERLVQEWSVIKEELF